MSGLYPGWIFGWNALFELGFSFSVWSLDSTQTVVAIFYNSQSILASHTYTIRDNIGTLSVAGGVYSCNKTWLGPSVAVLKVVVEAVLVEAAVVEVVVEVLVAVVVVVELTSGRKRLPLQSEAV